MTPNNIIEVRISIVNSKWYITRYGLSHPRSMHRVREYLHRDRLWHKSLMSEVNLDIVGYFDTKEEAEALLREMGLTWV